MLCRKTGDMKKKAHNWSFVHDINLKFLQEIDNFMSYNFGRNHKKSDSKSRLVEKFIYSSSGFSVLQKTELL